MSSALKQVLGNGVQEIRFAFSQTAPASASLRAFVATVYPQIKSISPSFPVLVRESSAAQPKITFRYDFGVEKSASTLSSASDVEKSFSDLVNQAAAFPKSDESKSSGKIQA